MPEDLKDRVEHLLGCLETSKNILLDDEINLIIECVFNKELDYQMREKLINFINNDEKTFDGFVKRIKNVSELTVDDLEKNSDLRIIMIQDDKTTQEVEIYSKEQYKEIRKVVDETILAGIEKPIEGNFESEFKVFCEICSRLANHYVYDYNACKLMDDGIDSGEIVENSQNSYGCLVKGESVCTGVSTTLKNILACIGMEAKCVVGYPLVDENASEQDKAGHAWNQVNIGGVWFNFDLTWMRDEIVKNNGEVRIDMLKTDGYFKEHEKYSQARPDYIEKCELPAIYLLYTIQNNLRGIDEKGVISTEIINQMLLDTSIKLSNEERAELISYLSFEDVVKYLNSEECKSTEFLKFVASINSDLAKMIVRDISINISTQRRFLMLEDFSDNEFIKECFENDSLKFDLGYKYLLLLKLDNEYIQEKINTGIFDEALSIIQSIIIDLKSVDFIEECIRNNRVELINGDINRTLEELENDIFFMGDEKYISDWQEKKEEIREIFEQQRRENEFRDNLETEEDYNKILGNLVIKGAEEYEITTVEISSTYGELCHNTKSRNVECMQKGGEKNDRS